MPIAYKLASDMYYGLGIVTPPVCAKCGEQQPGHGEMECLQYEYCRWCRQSGSYGFIGRHRCQVMDDGNPLVMDYDDRDTDLWANND